ncbi:MAG: hypothetical protein IJV24_06165 [Prevotella sp.]|nr:hypothetical protein [Prevotella sp.]
MTSRKRLVLHLALVPVVTAVTTALAACAGRLFVGLWATMSQLLVFFAVLSLFYAGLAVYVYLKEEYIL